MKRALVVICGCLLALAVLAATQSQYFSGDVIVAGLVRDPAGLAYIKDAPGTGGPYGRQTNGWVSLGAGGGLSDAPSDGDFYGRKNGAWLQAWAAGYIQDGPSTTTPYIRYANDWVDGRTWFAATNHTHSIADTTGLQGAIDGKASTNHTHAIADTTGLQGALDGKSATNHTHVISDTTGLQGALDGKASTNHTHAAGDITSGELASARLGSGTPSTSTYLRGKSGGGHEWATLPTAPEATNGIPDAPSDGIAYTRKDAAWVGLSASDVASGTLPSGRISGTYSGLTGLGSLSGLTVTGTSSLKATQGGSAAAHFAVWMSDPTTSGNTVYWRSASQMLSDIGAAASSHSHDWADITGEPSFVQTSRQVATAHSITGGGDLSADRTLSLVGDSASPGNSRYYGTDGSGTRGFHDIAGSHTHPDLANHVFITVSAVTDTHQDGTYRTVLGTVKSGYSSTLASGALSSGSVVRIEAAGVFVADDGHSADVELRIGSSLTLHFDITEPLSTGPTEGSPWNLVAWVTITTAGSSAAVNINGWMDYADNTGGSSGVYAPSPVSRSKAIVSGTLNTTTGNSVDLLYRGNDSNSDSFSCTHFILQQF